MKKQNVLYLYNGILFDHKNELSVDSWYTIDEPWKHYSSERSQKWKATDCMIPLIWNVQYK